jgi:hypothetical protein
MASPLDGGFSRGDLDLRLPSWQDVPGRFPAGMVVWIRQNDGERFIRCA